MGSGSNRDIMDMLRLNQSVSQPLRRWLVREKGLVNKVQSWKWREVKKIEQSVIYLPVVVPFAPENVSVHCWWAALFIFFVCVCVCVSRLPSKLWLQLIVALSLLLHRSVDLQPVMFWIFLQQTNIQFLNVPSCKENSQYAWQMAKIHNCVLLHHCYKHSHIHPLQPPSRS